MIQELDLAPGERARFISDVHFGHAKALAREPEELAFLLEECTHLVVCGDLSETRESPCQAEGLEKRARFLQMCRDAGVQPVLLAGNHDPDEKAGLLKLQGGRVCALHGHALFKEVAPWGWEYLKNKQASRELIAAFPEADTDLRRRLELARAMSVLVPPIYTRSGACRNKLVRFLAHSAWPPERPAQILLAWLTMMRRMRKFTERFFPEAEVVIFGHLHRRAVTGKRGGRLYVNQGACFHHAECWAADVTAEGGVSIRSYTPEGYDGPAVVLR